MKRLVPGLVLAVLLALPGAVRAQHRGQGWSVLAADSLGKGTTAFSGQIGWPGLTLGVLHGTSPTVDVGGKFTFNWGREGVTDWTDPGVKFQAWLRVMLAQSGNLSFAFTFQPGPLFYLDNAPKTGLALPVAFVVGFAPSSALMVNFGLDLPFYVYFGRAGTPVLPVLFGGGAEYFVDNRLAFTFNLRMGPSLFFDYDDSAFTMEALFGVAYRF